MPELTTTFRRNLFEIENARNLTREEVVRTFVPPQSFWRLLSPKNHILLGSRGSGKTAIAKMLSHDHLAKWDNKLAKRAIEAKSFIGMYLPTRLEWVGGMRNKPWQTPEEKEAYFCWRLNVASCLAFLNAAESCLDIYSADAGGRARAERSLCKELSSIWVEEGDALFTINTIREYMDRVEYCKQQQLARKRSLGTLPVGELPVGMFFDIELFHPLRRAIAIARSVFSLPDECAWLLCLDEAEFLEDEHQRILNTHMRAFSGNLFFKITTMPYAHYASETTTNVSLDAGHDFDYVYLDPDPVFQEHPHSETEKDSGFLGARFAKVLFDKRAAASGPKFARVSVDQLLGKSELLDPRAEDWKATSKNMLLLRRYASEETVERADRLAGSVDFMSQVGRKIHGALLLRHKIESQRGHRGIDAFSGASMAIRCGDANPRRLIRIFNAMLLIATWRKVEGGQEAPIMVKKTSQSEVLSKFSDQTLAAVQSEPKIGRALYELLSQIGGYMKHCLHERPLTTDQISSVIVDHTIRDEDWELVQRAVSIGLLYPNINPSNPDELPVREGRFHLAYALAPHFRILPRRGKARTLVTIRRFFEAGSGGVNSNSKQLSLFEEPEGEE